MVMRVLNDDKSPAAAGGAIEEGRRPTMVAAPAAASPELLRRPLRRTFTARDKLRILAEIDTARGTPGGIGGVLRREGLYPPFTVAAHDRLDRFTAKRLRPDRQGDPHGPRPQRLVCARLGRSVVAVHFLIADIDIMPNLLAHDSWGIPDVYPISFKWFSPAGRICPVPNTSDAPSSNCGIDRPAPHGRRGAIKFS